MAFLKSLSVCLTGNVFYLTVLFLFKLTEFAVALRLRCGSCKLNFFTLFHHFSLNLRKLYKVWSLVGRRVTRRLTRLQTMYYVQCTMYVITNKNSGPNISFHAILHVYIEIRKSGYITNGKVWSFQFALSVVYLYYLASVMRKGTFGHMQKV